MNNLPTIFHEILTRQFGEIIREVEELIDKGRIIMTYENIYKLIADNSEKARNYSKVFTYDEYFQKNGNMLTLNQTAFIVQKELFIKTDEEVKTSEAIISTLDDDLDHSHQPYQDIYHFEDISTDEGLHLFKTPIALSNYCGIWHEFYDFKKAHKVTEDVCSSYFLLNAIATIPSSKTSTNSQFRSRNIGNRVTNVKILLAENPFELISKYVAKNYIQNVISSINYNIDTDSEACSFLLKEIYKATRLYTMNDIDKHITTDIPVYPYTKGKTEVLGVYYYKPEDTDVCEYLFITERDCFSVHMKVDFPFRDWYHTTEVLEFGSVATVFGNERTITPEELVSLNGLVIGETPIIYVDNFDLDESSLLAFCNNEHHQHFNSEIANYFIQHKGAWIQSPVQLHNDYEISIEGLDRQRFYEFGEPCYTEEEKQAMRQTELEKPQLALEYQPDKQTIDEEPDTVYDLADKDEFDFGSPKDENEHDNNFGLNANATDDEPEPRKRTNRKLITCFFLIPVIMIASFVYLVF